jgi:aspartate racemase
MPCHTAHHWHAALVADCPVPFLSIVEAACDAAAACTPAGAEVLVLGTRATLSARLYDAALQRRGLRVRLPAEDDLERRVLPAIADVKAGRTQAAGECLRPVIDASLSAGAGCVLLACTELPIATRAAEIRDARVVDPTTALAAACIDWWRRNGAHRQARPA